jgi:hypothetical protein
MGGMGFAFEFGHDEHAHGFGTTHFDTDDDEDDDDDDDEDESDTGGEYHSATGPGQYTTHRSFQPGKCCSHEYIQKNRRAERNLVRSQCFCM